MPTRDEPARGDHGDREVLDLMLRRRSEGSLPGVLAGVVLLASLQNALRLEDVSGQALNIVTGVLLVLSVLLPNIATSIRSNWQRRRLRQAAAQ